MEVEKKRKKKRENEKGRKKGNGSPREMKQLNNLSILGIFFAYSELQSF